jgi:Holliday junction resolvasome RuvABC endonuclease subunit
LAIDPASRGFGFAVMEGQKTLVDWGVKRTRSDKKAETLLKVWKLIRHYRPRMLILENGNAKGSRRCKRVRKLLTDIRAMAENKRVKTRSVSLLLVKKVFLAFRATTKHQIAQVIATQLPELAPRLPRQRKLWMPEDYRMSIFDATALALTYFYTHPARQGSVHNR